MLLRKMLKPWLMILSIFLGIVVPMISPLPVSAQCQSGSRWYAGVYQVSFNIWGVQGYTRVVDEFNPDPNLYLQAHRYAMALNNGEWVEAGWAKGVPYGNSLHRYSARYRNGQYLEYDHGTVPALTDVHIRIERGPASNRFNVYIDGVLRTVFDLNSAVVYGAEAMGETSNTCASLGTVGTTPDRRGRFSSMQYKATLGDNWRSWTSYIGIADPCYNESHSGTTVYIWGRCY